MDLESVVKRIEDLENQLSSIKKAFANQNSKVNQVDEKTSGFLDKVKEQNNELSKISSVITNLGNYDTEITKLRVNVIRQIEEAEKRLQLNQKMQEKLWVEETKSLNALIEKAKKDLNQVIEQKLNLVREENNLQANRIKDIENKIDSRIGSIEDQKASMNLYQQEMRQNKKIFETYYLDLEGIKKKQDEFSSKLDIITRDMKTFDNRLNEIIATETERKQSYIAFIEQQSLIRNDHDRVWTEWTGQFEESISQIYKVLPELQNQQAEMKKNKELFDEVSQKFDRRANEITEMYRLLDEKFRKEWTTYRNDLEKRWANVSLIMEDRQGGLDGKFAKINEKIIEIDDDTHEMQEALILMSREIQKGMQSLMSMVNGWMDAFGQIRSQK